MVQTIHPLIVFVMYNYGGAEARGFLLTIFRYGVYVYISRTCAFMFSLRNPPNFGITTSRI